MFDVWVTALIFQIAALIYSVQLLDAAKSLHDVGRIGDPARYARRLAIGALVAFLIVLALVVGMAWEWERAVPKNRDGLIIPMMWAGLNAALALCGAILLLQTSISLRKDVAVGSEKRRDRISRRLRVNGWLILLLPLLFLLVPLLISLFWLVALGAVFGISVTLIRGGRRKADQGAVLWALAIATERQLPLPEELDAVADGLSVAHRQKTRKLAELLRDGCPLTVALEQTPRVIPQYALLAAYVGEENGTLPAALRDAAVRQTRPRQQTTGVSSPTLVIAYVLMMPLFCALTLGFLMYFITPKYKKIFDSFDTELPEITKSLIGVSDFFVQQWWLMGPLLFLPAGILFCAAFAHIRGWGEYDPPLFRRWLRRLDVPNLLRNFAQTLAASRSPRDALEVMSVRHPRRAIRAALTDALRAVHQGDDCWHALKDGGLLRPVETGVLRAAQRVGNLPWALRELADGIERRFVYRWGAVLEFAQPVVVIGVALACGAIYFAFFTPLLKLIAGLS